MMKGMLAGLKVKSVIEVKGLVKATGANATGPNVTLMAIDFDALDAPALQKMAQSGADAPTPAMMRGLKGITVSEDEVTIEFTGKK
jgi:hypothetical protein